MPDPAENTDGTAGRRELPSSRGPLSEEVRDVLLRDPERVRVLHWSEPVDDPLYGDDAALALYCLYGLHYGGWRETSDGWKHHPELLAWRSKLESEVELRIRDEVGLIPDGSGVEEGLRRVLEASAAPSITTHLLKSDNAEHVRELAAHRGIWESTGAGAYTFGPNSAAAKLSLDFQTDLTQIPGFTLARANVMSMFTLHSRWHGARIGFVAHDRRAGVEAFASTLACQPELAQEILFGAITSARTECEAVHRILGAWQRDESSLLTPDSPDAASFAS
ncbi:MAG TPA: hypothetical protein VMT88_06845 [Actinomycetes bacterium]|nr:hypothetical protein [Actinomycetes bacterium]